MSTQSHYDKLGVDENSSFEEIQNARSRLLDEHGSDRKLAEDIEAAYDAILMDRLRLRQEGKIRVPDRIRFPERLTAESPAQPGSPAPKQSFGWLQRVIDNPSQSEVLWPAISFAGIGALGLMSPSVALALGVGFCLYFLNRKENKFGRAFLLTIASLLVGIVLGLQLGNLTEAQLSAFQMTPEGFAAVVTAFLFWLTSSFLR
ncbi:MAG: CPP1-like family protein [Cyanobacteria bacterium P01_A01_bin.135]